MSVAPADPRPRGSGQLRAWWILDVRGMGLIEAVCPLSGEPATLESVRPPAGSAAPGRLLVARSVRLVDDRWEVLGPARVVAAEAQNELGALIDRLWAECRNPLRLWKELGPVLASTAWARPEPRRRDSALAA